MPLQITQSRQQRRSARFLGVFWHLLHACMQRTVREDRYLYMVSCILYQLPEWSPMTKLHSPTVSYTLYHGWNKHPIPPSGKFALANDQLETYSNIRPAAIYSSLHLAKSDLAQIASVKERIQNDAWLLRMVVSYRQDG